MRTNKTYDRLLADAKRGHAAQFALAVKNFYGAGGARDDISNAIFWLREAAQNNTDIKVKGRAENLLAFFQLFLSQTTLSNFSKK